MGLLFPCFSFPSMFGVPCSVFGVLFFSFSASVFYKKLPPSALLPRTLGGLQLLVHFLFFFSLSVFHLRNLWFSFLTSFCSFPSSFIRVFIRAHPWLLFAFSFADPSHSRAAFCAHRRPQLIGCVAEPRDKKKPPTENLPAEQDAGRKEPSARRAACAAARWISFRERW